jgi:hypothetical protein
LRRRERERKERTEHIPQISQSINGGCRCRTNGKRKGKRLAFEQIKEKKQNQIGVGEYTI